jgi:hypothetical protein
MSASRASSVFIRSFSAGVYMPPVDDSEERKIAGIMTATEDARCDEQYRTAVLRESECRNAANPLL